MKIMGGGPVVFGSGHHRKNLRYFINLLEKAEPYAHFNGNFYADSVLLEDTGALMVTPALNDTIGGGIIQYRFLKDGSIEREDTGPPVFPPRPPQVTRLFPPGSVPSELFNQIKIDVARKRPG